MKAAILVESLTGNTWKAAEKVAANLQQEQWTITGLNRMRTPDYAAIQAADVVLIGTWVHGFIVVGVQPFGLSTISSLPVMRGKRAAVFCTFAVNPKKSLDTMTSAVRGLGADVIGGLALNRHKIDAHSEIFAERLIGAVEMV
jgi:flavodoxin